MKPTNIFLIRHGQSEANADRDVLKTIPDYKVQLTEKGREQAKNLVVELNEKSSSIFNRKYFVSPFTRTRQTLEIFLKDTYKEYVKFQDASIRHKPDFEKYMAIESPLIREQEWGQKLGEGFNYSTEKERQEYGMFYYRYPNGESGVDVYQRVSLFLSEMERMDGSINFGCGYTTDAFIFTHGFTMKIFLMKLLNLSVEEMESLATPRNCEYYHLQYDKWTNQYKLKTELRKRE